MEYKTHQVAGLLTAGFIICKSQIGFSPVWLQIVLATAVGAALPDIDHSKSTPARAVPIAGYLTGKSLRHRGPVTHSIWSIILTGVGLYFWGRFKPIVNIAMLSGMLSHHFLDMLTGQRLQWLWPLKIKLLPLPGMIGVSTGSFVERKLIRPALVLLSSYLWITVCISNKKAILGFFI